MPLYDQPRFLPAGDCAITVELANDISPDINARVRALSAALEQEHVSAIVDLVPTYRSLLVYYDPLQVTAPELQERILGLVSAVAVELPRAKVLPIPVAYGGEYGPDLDFVARHTGLSPDEVANIHSGSDYLVYMLGFNTGFPYLGGMSPAIAAPRLDTPRTRIPAGAVGIAQQQTGIYPVESPGGWQIIGRSPVRLFDPTREPPMPIAAGDFIRFVRIDDRQYRELEMLVRVELLQAHCRGEVCVTETMNAIEVLEGGFFTTIQDRGRFGYQKYGVPVSGAMDPFALRAANVLTGASQSAAALEITLQGPCLRFLIDTVLAIAGADLDPRLDGRSIPMWRAVAVQRGGVLDFGRARDGMRAYLSLAGGFDVPVVLGSHSTFTRTSLGGFQGRSLRAGDVLAAGAAPETVQGRMLRRDDIPIYGHDHLVRVMLGPQDEAFTAEGLSTFLSSEYVVSPKSDRIGCRMEGPAVAHVGGPDIVSDGIPFGAVQIAGDGLPIVLMADRGTTGGYTKIATVISTDLPLVAQSLPGDRIRFRAVSGEEAHQALRDREAVLDRLVRSPAVCFNRRHFAVRVDGSSLGVRVGFAPVRSDTRVHARPTPMEVVTSSAGATKLLQIEVTPAEGLVCSRSDLGCDASPPPPRRY